MLLWPTVTVFGFALVAALVVALGSSSTARYELERAGVQSRPRHVPAAPAPAPAPAAAPPAAAADVPAATVGGAATEGLAVWALSGESAAVEAAVEDQRRAQGSAVRVVTAPATQPADPAANHPSANHPSVNHPSVNHPAGRRIGDTGPAAAWWLVDEDSDEPVAGPFADRLEADWALLGHGLDQGTRVLYGAQRADGGLVRRQLPQERAWLADLGEQLDRLPGDWDELMTDDDALTTLLVEVAAAVVEAGLPLHDCIGDGASGGICLSPGPAHAGVLVTWHQHDRMSVQQVRGAAMSVAVQRTMDTALADLLTTMGFEVEPFGDGGASFVTGFASY